MIILLLKLTYDWTNLANTVAKLKTLEKKIAKNVAICKKNRWDRK